MPRRSIEQPYTESHSRKPRRFRPAGCRQIVLVDQLEVHRVLDCDGEQAASQRDGHDILLAGQGRRHRRHGIARDRHKARVDPAVPTEITRRCLGPTWTMHDRKATMVASRAVRFVSRGS